MFDFIGGGMLTGDKIDKEVRKGNIIIDPYDTSRINPNSYNLRLHNELLVYDRWESDIDKIRGGYNNYPKAEVINNNEDTHATNDDENTRDININNDEHSYPDITFSSTCNIASNSICIRNEEHKELSMEKKNNTLPVFIPPEGLVLYPGVLYIGRTVERTFTDKYIPMINGRSSGGRLGMSIHICAGFGDIGFDGTWTLEITVVEPLRVSPFAEIAQVAYFKPFGKKNILYNGRYQKQIDATASRFEEGKTIYRV